MDLSTYLLVVRRRWWVVVLTAGTVVGLAAVVSWAQVPTFESRAQIFVSLRGQETATDLVAGSSFARQQVLSYTGMVDAPLVLDPVIDELGLETSAEDLAGSVRATSPSGTSLIDVVVSTGSAESAARIADAVATSAARVLEDLEQPGLAGDSTVHLTVVRPASMPEDPTSPDLGANLTIGLLVGTALGLLAALLLEAADRTIRGRRDLTGASAPPVLAEIPARRRGDVALPLTGRHGTDPRADAVRMLRTTAELATRSRTSTATTLMVTAVLRDAATSATTLELAAAWADTGARVLVIDADLRTAAVGTAAGVPRAPGLAEVLLKRAEWRECVRDGSRGTLHLLPAGTEQTEPGAVIDSARIDVLLADAATAYDVVLLGVEAASTSSDAASLAAKVSGVLLVVGADRTTTTQLADALDVLHAARAEVVGLVLSGTSGSAASRARADDGRA